MSRGIITAPCVDCGAEPHEPCHSRIRRGRASTSFHPARKRGATMPALSRLLSVLTFGDRRTAVPGDVCLRLLERGGEPEDVRPACSDKTTGFWHCLSCIVDFEHNLAKDLHCSHEAGKPHVLAWICRQHGPEVP